MALVIGVDSSTQSTKVEARRIDSGERVAYGWARHPATTPPVSEQDPRVWWTALVDAIGQLGACRSDVVAISVAGQQHGLVLIDSEGEPVRPAILWNDTSSAGEAADLVQRLGESEWAEACGSVPTASFTISTLAWMAGHDPKALTVTDKVMLPHDYLTWRLSGEHVTDRGDASGTGWYDSDANEYRTDLLCLVVDDPESWQSRLPKVVSSGSIVGELSPGAAFELGLGKSVVVTSGTGDNMAGALGLGLKPGDVAVSLGTSGTIFALSSKPVKDPTGMVAGFADATDQYLPLMCTLNATKVTDTVARWVGTGSDGFSQLAMKAPAGFQTEIVIPFFDGERSPNLPEATGEIVGVTTATTRERLARAAHDGVLCSLLVGLDALSSLGVAATGTLYLIGGGSRSQAYRTRCADLYGSSIVVPQNCELVCSGASVQAAAAISGASPGGIVQAWELANGLQIDPNNDAHSEETKQLYASYVARY